MNWPTVKISKTCLPTEKYDPRQEPEDAFRYVDISSIDKERKIISHAPEIIGADAPSRARKRIKSGDILVSTVRPNLNAVAIVPDELDGQIASTGFCVLRPKSKVLDNKYLFFYSLTPDFIATLCSHVRGAHYPAVSDKNVKQVKIPFPSPSEQRRIVEILDRADELRKKRADADTKAARILPALFYQMFGDPATNPKGWPTGTLGEVTTDLRYGTSVKCNSDAVGLPVLRIPNIVSGHIDLAELKYAELPDGEVEKLLLDDGDILFVRTNGNRDYVGRCAVFSLDDKYLFASYLIRARLDKNKVDPVFISAGLATPMGRQSMSPYIRTTAGQSNISQQGLRQIPIIIPSLAKQKEFRRQIENLEMIEKHRGISSKKIDSLFETLLHRAFSGDLTAKWREGRMKELLAEMEEQAKALEAPAENNVVSINGKRHAGHEMYGKAALAAYITQKCHDKQYPLGRVKLAKLFFLVQRKAELELTQEFAKRAAGPLDDTIFKFLNLAKKKKWVSIGRAKGYLKPVSPGPEVQEAVEEAEKLLGNALTPVNDIIEKMRTWGRDALERWATVLHAAEELSSAGTEPTLENIKNSLLSHPVWKEKLSSDVFSDDNLTSTLKGLRSFGFLQEINQKG